MGKKTTSKSKEAYYARYKSSTYEKNRRLKLERTLKVQPNNEQVKQALKDNFHYRRGTPKAPVWTSSEIRIAQIVKSFAGSFDREVFNTNPKTAGIAMSRLSKPKVVKKLDTIQERAMFSMKARLTVKGTFANVDSKNITGIY